MSFERGIRRLFPRLQIALLICIAVWISGCSVRQPTIQAPGGTPVPLPATAAPATEVPVTPLVSLTPVVRLTPGAAGVSGGIVLQDGACCIGGVVNSTASLRIALPAASAGGQVTEMRLRLGGGGCAEEAQMAALAWQPYQPALEQALTISTINWVGWYASVQYRDDQGRLSPVYCDDISVEGMPAPQP